jgi:hypothetical protein
MIGSRSYPSRPVPRLTPPTAPRLTPPKSAPVQTVKIDYSRLADEVYKRIQADADRFRGPAGKDGKDADSADLVAIAQAVQKNSEQIDQILNRLKSKRPDYDKIANEVQQRLPPFYPMWIDKDGNVIDETPNGVRLGETMPLRIESIIRNAN